VRVAALPSMLALALATTLASELAVVVLLAVAAAVALTTQQREQQEDGHGGDGKSQSEVLKGKATRSSLGKKPGAREPGGSNRSSSLITTIQSRARCAHGVHVRDPSPHHGIDGCSSATREGGPCGGL